MNTRLLNHWKRLAKVLAFCAWAQAAPLPAIAHEGEDHSHDEPAAVAPMATQPEGGTARASSQSDEFELVAVLNTSGPASGTLTVYLDTFATNEPVKQAKVDIESSGFKATAAMQAPGVYTVKAPPLARPGRHALTVAIEAGETADLLDVTLDTRESTTASGAANEHSGFLARLRHGAWLPALGGLALLIGAAVLVSKARARKMRALS